MAKLMMICVKCRGDNILFDALATWDTENQQMELAAYFEKALCEDCDEEVTTLTLTMQ